MMRQLPYDLKNMPAPHKLDIKKVGEAIGNVIGFLFTLIVFVTVLLILILAAASVPAPLQLQTPDDETVSAVSEVRI